MSARVPRVRVLAMSVAGRPALASGARADAVFLPGLLRLRSRRWTLREWAAPSLVALVLGGASATRAQVSPNGGELQVNTYTTFHQKIPGVAADGQGNFVVTWQTQGSFGTDANGYSIQAQRFAANGAALGGEFQVNTFTTGTQSYPAIAADGQGNFVVVWHSFGSFGTDPTSYSIQAQRFAANGAALGGELQVNTYTTGNQSSPAVAVDGQGNFVVAWESNNGSFGTDSSGFSIQAQRFAASGALLGGEFQVNTYTTSEQRLPVVAADGQGNFVVAWHSNGSYFGDSSDQSIQAQRYAANGDALGQEFQVNTYTPGSQERPAVAVDGQGGFVVVWQSGGSNGTDTSSLSIQARRYDADGDPLGGELQVNTYTTSIQFLPAVAVDVQGNFVVAWQSFGSSGTDSSFHSVQAQRYDASGADLGAQFQVNTYTTSSQRFPAVAVDSHGNFVVAWDSDGSSGTDASGYSIQAQRYDGLFRDGFEAGTTARWSATEPPE